MYDYIVGIDIGSSKICGAVGKLDKNDQLQIVSVTSYKSNGINKSIVVDIDNTAESIMNCIKQLETMVDIKISSVYISLPSNVSELINTNGIIAISSEDREIRQTDVNRVLEAAKLISVPSDKEMVGIIPQEYVLDGCPNIKDPIGMTGLRLEVKGQVITIKNSIMNNLLKSLNRAGLEVKGIVFQPLAISDVVLTKEETNMGTLLIDVGADVTQISIFEKGNLSVIESIPLGGSSITNDIALCLKLPVSQAEKLKIKYGSLKKNNYNTDEKVKVSSGFNDIIEVDCKILNEIIEARVEEILYLVIKKIYDMEKYNDISGVVLVGGGLALFDGISEFGKELIGKPLRIGIPDYVGVTNPLYPSVVGIIRDVANSQKTNNYKNNNDEVKEYSYDKNYKSKKNNDFKNSKIIGRLKNIFSEFF